MKKNNLHSNMFLFKLSAPISPIYSFKNLHSNMFLFKFRMCQQTVNRVVDLHSNMFLFKCKERNQKTIHNYIYIPICFYLNVLDSQILQRITITFTFQYVSKSATTTSSGGLLLALIRAFYCSPKRAVSQALLLIRL